MVIMSKEQEEAEKKIRETRNFRRILTLVLVPLVFAFLALLKLIVSGKDDKAVFSFALGWMYIFFVAGVLWITNVITLPTTGFLPFVLLPFLGTVHSNKLAKEFMSNSNMAAFGILIIMMSVDGSGLRRRLTLRILKHTSGCTRQLYIYIYIITTLLSMWISSIGAAYLMMKTIEDILETLKEEVSHGALGDDRVATLEKIIGPSESKSKMDAEKNSTVAADAPSVASSQNKIHPAEGTNDAMERSMKEPPPPVRISVEEELKLFETENDKLLQIFGGELLFAVAVAANIGGTLWPHCSTVGMEMSLKKYFHTMTKTTNSSQIVYRWTEASWMLYSFPLLLLNSIVALTFLLWVNFSTSSLAKCLAGSRGKRLCNLKQCDLSLQKMKEVFSIKKEQLGPWSFQEKNIVVLIVILVVACLTRLPLFMRGWSELLPYRAHSKFDNDKNKTNWSFIETGDSFMYVTIAFLLFMIPKSGLKFCAGPKTATDKPKREYLIGWKALQSKFPWGILVLIGASSVIGEFSENTIGVNVAIRMSKAFPIPDPLSIALLKLILMGILILGSIFFSNTGSAIAVLHVWAKLASIYKDKNLLLGGGAVLPPFSVASLCFFLPHSSIPTAMVYMYGQKKQLSMWYFLRLGVPLTLCTLIITIGYALLWSPDSLLYR